MKKLKAYKTDQFDGMNPGQIRDFVQDRYRKMQGTKVVNVDKEIAILINSKGREKTAKVLMSKEKAIIVLDLYWVLANATFNNWGEPKPKHIKEYRAVGFLNFKYVALINGKRKSFRIPVMLTQSGKFQYDLHEDK